MNIGVLGGTFDPIHKGHLVLVEEARGRANLAEILFVPANLPWLKTDRSITPVEHRVEMVRLAIADNPYLKLSTVDIERGGPSYTVDTISDLQGQIGAEDELFLILGWDSLAELPQWHEASRLITMCHLVVVPRPSFPRPKLKSLDKSLPGTSKRVMLIDEPYIDIGASNIRERLAKGLSVLHLVPEPVNRYIKEHRLYSTE
ncbi:nicotinate-nucleotide adenylyltransferase [Chloroflexota bacterium]